MENKNSYAYIQQNRFYIKKCNKRQRRSIDNDKEFNSSRGYNNWNIYASNTGAPKYINQILKDLKRDLDNGKIIIGIFNTLSTVNNR